MNPAFLDPEYRRVFLEEIAHLRDLRGRYRLDAGDADLSYSAQIKGRLRADGCNRAIASLRDVWAGLLAVERRHTEEYLAASVALDAEELHPSAEWNIAGADR